MASHILHQNFRSTKDISISIYHDFMRCMINTSNIITGECLEKFTSQDGEAALKYPIMSLEYDERDGDIFTSNYHGIVARGLRNFHMTIVMPYVLIDYDEDESLNS
jgi:hypothetical protein